MRYYEITGADLKEAAKAAYDLSHPQGLGWLHAKNGGLTDANAQHLISRERLDSFCALDMDYVDGRSCKFTVYRVNGRLFIPTRWYDHSADDMQELLRRIDMINAPLVENIPEPEINNAG